METNKFFKFLWRANAILIFFAAIGAIILLFTAVSYVISDLFHEDTPPPAIETVDSVFAKDETIRIRLPYNCLLYTSPSPRDRQKSRMPSSA